MVVRCCPLVHFFALGFSAENVLKDARDCVRWSLAKSLLCPLLCICSLSALSFLSTQCLERGNWCVRIFSAAHPQHVCLLIFKPCTLRAVQHAQVVCMQVGPSLFSSKVAVTQLSGFCPGQKIYIKQHCVGKTFKRTFYLSHSVSLLNQVLTNQLFWNPGGGHKSPRPALDASQPQPKIFLFNFILSEFLKERLLFAFFTWTCTTQ